jgi:predicted RNase H-like nuclease (RuvC/YqgF family)
LYLCRANDDVCLESASKNVEFKKKTFSREEYVEMPIDDFRTLCSIARNGIKGNKANLSIKKENEKLKRENAKLKKDVQTERKAALEKFGNENKRLKEEKSELTKENYALKSENKNLTHSKTNEILFRGFINEKGLEKDFNNWANIVLPINVKDAEPSAAEKALQDWKNMSEAQREEIALKAYLREIHM